MQKDHVITKCCKKGMMNLGGEKEGQEMVWLVHLLINGCVQKNEGNHKIGEENKSLIPLCVNLRKNATNKWIPKYAGPKGKVIKKKAEITQNSAKNFFTVWTET